MNANQIEVGISFRFHCPMTGVLVTAPDHFGPSPATAFLLGPEADEFDYLSPALEPLWHEVRDAHAAGSRSPGQLFDAFCRRLGGHDHLVLFSFVPAGSRSGAAHPAVHVCIDFGYPSADGEDDGSPGDHPAATAVVPLPRHVPLSALGILLDACRRVAGDPQARGRGPDGPLVGSLDAPAGAGVAEGVGAPGEEHAASLERLARGEKLALCLHRGWLADGVALIDGRDYRPTAAEIRERAALGDRAGSCDPRRLPDDPGCYGLRIGAGGDRLTIEPIVVEWRSDGGPVVRTAEFPESLRRRVAAFLARLA